MFCWNKQGWPELRHYIYMPQSLPVVSHLIGGPEDITVCLPVLPCTKVLTCLPAGAAVLLCVFGNFQGVGALSWKCETVSWQVDQARWRAWQRRDALFDQMYVEVCVTVCVWVREKKKARETAARAGRSRKTNVTDSSVTHAALQASGWWLIQHDDEPWWFNTGPSSRLRLLSLELSERRGNSPRLWTDTAKMERGHLGHLFIYFLPYAVFSAMQQWVSSMRHKVNAPSTLWGWAVVSASRAAYSILQHRKWSFG